MNYRQNTILISVLLSFLVSLALLVGYHLYLVDKLINPVNDVVNESLQEYKIDELGIQFYDVRNPSLGITSASFNFVIQVSNPYEYHIVNPHLFYEVIINGTDVAIGKTYLPDILAKDNRIYPASFIISYIDLGKSVISAIKSGNFELNLMGEVTSKGKVKKFNISYYY